MMPHPERMVDEIISNKDGVNLFSSLLIKMKITNQIIESHGLKLEEFENIKKLLKKRS